MWAKAKVKKDEVRVSGERRWRCGRVRLKIVSRWVKGGLIKSRKEGGEM